MTETTLIRPRYLLLAASDLVYNPHLHLQGQIKAASKIISEYFDEVDASLDDGKTITQSLAGRKQIQKSMQNLIHSARLQGFQLGSRLSKRQMPVGYGKELWAKAGRQADNVNRLMTRTTRRRLINTPDSDYVLASDRADMAARYEASRAYFRGVQDAVSGGSYHKAWITSSMEPCNDCTDNEGQGYIPVDQVFESGDIFPAAHQHCLCGIAMKRG